jgi:hypothetical protein
MDELQRAVFAPLRAVQNIPEWGGNAFGSEHQLAAGFVDVENGLEHTGTACLD